MVKQLSSAYQQIRAGNISVGEAIDLLVIDGELNYQFLDKKLINSVSKNWPLRQAIPLFLADEKLFVACEEGSIASLDNVLPKFVNKFGIEYLEINSESWKNLISQVFEFAPQAPLETVDRSGTEAKNLNSPKEAEPKSEKLAQLGAHLLKTIDDIPLKRINAVDDTSIASEVRKNIAEAARVGASDIHYEPLENFLIVRFRIDGVLMDICKYMCTADADYRKIMLARIKIIANLNIAESRIPQDGRVTEFFEGKKIDLRVSTLPCLHGEKCVIRLLPHENKFLELTDLGMPEDLIPTFESWLKLSQGMILITGPTGSGKTSTLYTSLAKVIDVTKNVVTVEDPVEFQLARVNQVQVNAKAGLTFSAGLRSILRQDPDIIMLGEIRDKETAEIAIQASLTGHLVLSTLHTNDAPSSINRLIDMGVEPYLVASALVGVVAQRLMRLACPHCAETYIASESDLEVLKIEDNSEPVEFVRAKGCQKCNNTGYSGREGIFEMMPLVTKMKSLVHEKADLEKFKAIMVEKGMKSLFEAAKERVVAKKTTLEEFLRVVPREQ
ncbi:MAG: type II/IV secretion system protein [Candidatus Caenarcaniphilales bacterium]|nr:type II/IV secretion system protein [Candidatus Caenarcaniphilales bacterium]